jgi:hypothetical protein
VPLREGLELRERRRGVGRRREERREGVEELAVFDRQALSKAIRCGAP